MMMTLIHFPASSDPLHARFLTILPTIERHGQIYFRHEKCSAKKADRIAEMVGLAWQWFVRLTERGKDATGFPSALAVLAARSVRCGRRIAGMVKTSDVMNERTQYRRGFVVVPLPSSTATPHEDRLDKPHGQRQQDEFEQRLQHNLVTPVDEQVQFKLDFAAWLHTLTARERRLIRAMLRNERTKDLSRYFEVSPGRVSQLRRQFRDDWRRFIGDAVIGGPRRARKARHQGSSSGPNRPVK